MTPPTKILLMLQYYEADRDKAMRVARLIADLEPRHSEQADLLFVARFDCTHDKKAMDYVSRKFNLYSYINKGRRGKEWPLGPNDLWFGGLDYVYSVTEAKRFPPYRAILTFESDAVPIRPGWISELSRAWDAAQPTKALGAMQTSPGVHLNGNALFSGDIKFLKHITRDIGGCSPHAGWDYALRETFRKLGWRNSPLFRSWWNYPAMTAETFEQLLREEVVFFHGIKNDDLVNHVRRRYSLAP